MRCYDDGMKSLTMNVMQVVSISLGEKIDDLYPPQVVEATVR